MAARKLPKPYSRKSPALKLPKLPKPVEDVIAGAKEIGRQGKAAVETVREGVRKIKKATSK